MKFVFLFILLVFLAGSCYVFARGWQLLPQSLAFKIAYSVLFASLWLSYPVAMLGKDSLPLPLIKWLAVLGSIFMVLVLYLILILLVIDLFRIVNHFLHFFPAFLTDNPLLVKRVTGGIVLGALTVLLLIGHYRFAHPVVEELELQVDKEANGRKELHVVAVSDIHLGFTIGKARLRQYVEQINSLKPDVIIISGDLIDVSPRPLEAYRMQEELRELQAPLGVYMVTGNHEYISGIEASKKFISKTGIRLLENAYASPDSTFIMAGQNDLTAPDRKSMRHILQEAPKDLPVIGLIHQPYDINLQDASDNRVDFLFCGHTHQGQVWPGNQIVKMLFKVPYGYDRKEQTHIFVSSGLGIWGPQFRIGTQSEIISVKMRFK